MLVNKRDYYITHVEGMEQSVFQSQLQGFDGFVNIEKTCKKAINGLSLFTEDKPKR